MARTPQKTIAASAETHEKLTQYALLLAYHLDRKVTLDEALQQLMSCASKVMGLCSCYHSAEVKALQLDELITYANHVYRKTTY